MRWFSFLHPKVPFWPADSLQMTWPVDFATRQIGCWNKWRADRSKSNHWWLDKLSLISLDESSWDWSAQTAATFPCDVLKRFCFVANLHSKLLISPCPHKIDVTGGVVVRKVPSKLWNTCLVVVSVLWVELYVAVTVQKHQLQRHTEKQIVNLKFFTLTTSKAI